MQDFRNATSSHEHLVPGFVKGPDGRGTFDILWSCLAAVLLNTWTVLHLNIPPYDHWWRRFVHKAKWWIICMVCPDGLVVNSWEQWRNARRSVTTMKDFYPWWTKTHGFYAEMGGYRVKEDVPGGQTYIFRSEELAWLCKNNLITLPEVSLDELNDRSNADWVAKGIACVQSVWFMFQICARINQKLPITTLELLTVAFISCTGLTYCFWWHKPMDLETHTTVVVPPFSIGQFCRLARETCFGVTGKTHWYRPPPREGHDYHWDWFWWEKPMRIKSMEIRNRGDMVPKELQAVVRNNFSAQARVTDWYMPAMNESHGAEWGAWDHFAVFLVGAMFNGIHCAAWKFSFPTFVESLLWKVSVCTMLGVITLWVPEAALFAWLSDRSRLKSLPYWIATLCYFLARWYLLVEVLVGLRALEPRIFMTVEWTDYFPHI